MKRREEKKPPKWGLFHSGGLSQCTLSGFRFNLAVDFFQRLLDAVIECIHRNAARLRPILMVHIFKVDRYDIFRNAAAPDALEDIPNLRDERLHFLRDILEQGTVQRLLRSKPFLFGWFWWF